MHAAVAASIMAATATLASAGNVVVNNSCTFPIWFSSFMNEDPRPAAQGIASGGAYTEVQRTPAQTGNGNNTIVIGTEQTLTSPFEFSYSQNYNNNDYYSVLTVYGNPFGEDGYQVTTDALGVPPLICPPSDTPCAYTRTPDSPIQPVFHVPDGSDFIVTFCEFDGH